jgi:hypothetical protein
MTANGFAAWEATAKETGIGADGARREEARLSRGCAAWIRTKLEQNQKWKNIDQMFNCSSSR